MGGAGCPYVKCRSDRTGTSGKFSSRTWLGTIYRRLHGDLKPSGSPDRIHLMGLVCAKKSFDVKQSEPSDLKGSASKSVIGLSWILGKQALQQNEQLPDRARC